MDCWKNLTISKEAQVRLKNILSKLGPEEFSNDWYNLMEFNKKNNLSFNGNFCSDMDVDFIEFDFKQVENFKNLLKEALERNEFISETAMLGLSSDGYCKIFCEIRNDLDELKFSTFCGFITSWKNDILIDQALKTVILPKLQEKKESSACMIFDITKLASAIPDKFCNLVFIPLLTDQNVCFSDVELMSNVFYNLPPAFKEIVLRKFTEKHKFQNSDWLLLQPLVKEFSRNSIIMVTKCIHKHSSLFTTSQTFGKFLVNFCKNINFVDNKELLFEAVNIHQTLLLKRQALKYLEKL